MNREEHLQKTFPLKDGTTYIQNLDNVMCEYSGLPSVQSYEPKGAGVGGESLKEKFIDSANTMGSIGSKPKTQSDYQREHAKIPPCIGHELESQKEIEKGDIDFMYKWIREKSGK